MDWLTGGDIDLAPGEGGDEEEEEERRWWRSLSLSPSPSPPLLLPVKNRVSNGQTPEEEEEVEEGGGDRVATLLPLLVEDVRMFARRRGVMAGRDLATPCCLEFEE